MIGSRSGRKEGGGGEEINREGRGEGERVRKGQRERKKVNWREKG